MKMVGRFGADAAAKVGTENGISVKPMKQGIIGVALEKTNTLGTKMLNWDELSKRYETLKEARKGQEPSRLADCMLQILPQLRETVKERIGTINLSLVMIALELHVPNTSQVVLIQSVSECNFIISVKNNHYQVINEILAGQSEVVEQVIQCLQSTLKSQ